MNIVLLGINSKYIHTNLAIRYLKANCSLPVEIKEFTIKDSVQEMLDYILESDIQILGISVYIWNIELIRELLQSLKENAFKGHIILGGPEVSYESEDLLINKLADFIISNEGEIAFNMLVKAINEGKTYELVPNLIYIKDNKIIQNTKKEIRYLNTLNNPYLFSGEDISNKIQYIELSRGCPYNCSYCLASLEKKVRYFDIESVYENITYLYSRGAKTFKFLDRTFNLKPETAIELFRFIIENDFTNAIFQFEISGDILTKEIIQYLKENCPENRIRFEIGIQSIHDKVNQAVSRKQNTDKLFDNIRRLKKTNVILHLDLIAGLPFEDLPSFIETFNQTFYLFAEELQLGFLKLLKGTALYYQQGLYEYQITKEAPYEIIENKFLSRDDLAKIHIVEESLEIFWNKGFMRDSVKLITKNYLSPFQFFLELAILFQVKGHSFHRYQLSDVFETLETYMDEPMYKYEIRYDYLKYHTIKPKIYWQNETQKNDIIRLFHAVHPEMNIDQLYKYSVVIDYHDSYLIALYFPDRSEFYKLKA